ncbi:GumC family protein [Shewanella fidelis]|uniref:Exopolysaccharide biosynthesis protein n=1 Tax=Shewanella fidelis TaxID=173509 RepID=A0AAW8NMI2_9GAMM|nr:exopolysaccharide biosynthesis protein [Shewanella fidelis]MDR8524402.1 exopolysaccharide biosynthesis protein [Shewanella fidelis]MDW4811879.1 exopolysaccharide biosynthesis protein [Shewanella fidelis]MDW4817182.1 exopolysaccharide biosynthesis protein [Shewanella fidelis]MDW4821252.1 exopolysaccharide biosynthesis protein [Shewanella fidelis]MDW4822484.1 exopolysaccharide biosynthesis protein [Shewanella fidelis]
MKSKYAYSPLLWAQRYLVNGSKQPAQKRKQTYVKLTLLLLLLIWLLVLAFIFVSPSRYVSQWTLILPGSGTGANVTLDSVGQANSSTTSPYTSSAIDPRVNYKTIAMSKSLLANAAKSLALTRGEFGKPKLKLPNQTGIMQFSIKANSAKAAQRKAWAHYHSLQAILSELRSDEIEQREDAIRVGMASFANKVEHTQEKLLEFQSEHGLVSLEQFKELALTMERLRHNKVNLVSELQGVKASQKMLEIHLSLTPKQAAGLLTLKNDQLFQQLLISYTRVTATLAEYRSRFGKRHPKVVTYRDEQASILSALSQRCNVLLGYVDKRLMLMLSADDLDGRAQLMQQLLTLNTEAEGLRHQIDTLTQQIHDWDHRFTDSNDDAAKLEDLQREHQVATAVFTSALAKMDIGKADIYAAYPLLQLMAAPSLAEEPDNLVVLLAIVGGIAASISIIAGMGMLWIRKPILQKILTK